MTWLHSPDLSLRMAPPFWNACWRMDFCSWVQLCAHLLRSCTRSLLDWCRMPVLLAWWSSCFFDLLARTFCLRRLLWGCSERSLADLWRGSSGWWSPGLQQPGRLLRCCLQAPRWPFQGQVLARSSTWTSLPPQWVSVSRCLLQLCQLPPSLRRHSFAFQSLLDLEFANSFSFKIISIWYFWENLNDWYFQ